jgi:hypothetical protein
VSRRAPLTLALAALFVAGCGARGVSVSAPSPSGKLAAACSSLVAAIPAELVTSGGRVATKPVSAYTAAFGKPAVTIRCGAPLPRFDPGSEVETVDGVDWLVLPDVGSASHFAAWRSPTLLDVVIPHDYLPADVLPALSPLVAKDGMTAYPTAGS